MASYDHSKVAQFVGGNSLDKAEAGRVADFVKEHGGHTVITKVRVPRVVGSPKIYSTVFPAGPHRE